VEYSNKKSPRLLIPKNTIARYLQTRPFAPSQADENTDKENIDKENKKEAASYHSENLLAKLISTPTTYSVDNYIQSKPFYSKLRSRSMTIQPKLSIGEPDDKYEKEADNTAARVVQQINSPAQTQGELSQDLGSSLVLQSKRDIVQRLTDANGTEITDEMIKAEQNLDTLKEWATLSGDRDWEDESLLESIQAKIVALQPESSAPLSNAEENVDVVSENNNPTPTSNDLTPTSTKTPKEKPYRKPKTDVKPTLPAGWILQSQLPSPEKGGKNATRSWGKGYPHVSVLMGEVNPKDSSVKIKDIHWSKGASDTHFHWVSQGGGKYVFDKDPSQFRPEGRELLKKAYLEVKRRGELLGLTVECPSGITV